MSYNSTLQSHNAELREILNRVNELPNGAELPELSSPGGASDLMEGKQLIDGEGKVVDGTFTIRPQLTRQDSLIEQIQIALQDKASGGGLPEQEKTVEITENGTHEIVPDDGYTLSKTTAKVNVPVPDGYIKPSGTLEIVQNGKHDAKAFESVDVNVPVHDGYIQPSGTLEVTENGVHDVESYKSANVNVPIPDGYIVPSGRLNVTVNGIYDAKTYESVRVAVPVPNGYVKPSGTLEVTENGTFDVTEKASVVVSVPEREVKLQNIEVTENGTYSADSGYDGIGQVTVNVEASGGSSDAEIGLLTRTLTEYSNTTLTEIGESAFYSFTSLVSLNLPALVTMNGRYGIAYCSSLKSLCFPSLELIGYGGLRDCTALERVDCHVLKKIDTNGLYNCTALTTLIIRSASVCTLNGSNSLGGSPIANGTGYIYVPSALIDDYKAKTTWKNYADQFRAIEDYPEICG